MLEALLVKQSDTETVDPKASIATLSRRAAELAGDRRYNDAVPIWVELAALLPEHEGVAMGLGSALVGAGRFGAALQQLASACVRFPENPVLLRLEAHALRRLGNSAAAVGALLMALEVTPECIECHADLAAALHLQRRLGAALPHAAYAHGMAPSTSHATVLVDILLELGRRDEALPVIDANIEANIELPSMLLLRSFCLSLMSRHPESLTSARLALQAAPDDENIQAGVAMSLLAHGELTPQAWKLYESRTRVLGMNEWPHQERRWRGQNPQGATILVHAEQGFGDTINFIRYVPMLAALGARVVLVVQPGLLRLLSDTPGAERVIAGGRDLPDFDWYVPLLSLPGLLGTTLDTIPPPLPLHVPATILPAPHRTRDLRVGLVWGGSQSFIDNGKRSLDPAALAPLAAIEGVTFYNLQFATTDFPMPGMVDPMRGVADFAETASIIAGLDMVISVDTSVAHLAATLGKPVWMLSRIHGCWRWFLDREDTPWYPTMRIYRQQRLAVWDDVIARIAADLGDVVAQRSRPEQILV